MTELGEYSGENYDASAYTIAELQRQLLEAKAQWQLIETAPKDGTLILVFYPDLHGHDRYSLRYWSAGDWGSIREAWSDQWRQIKPSSSPTHWMPLAEAPALSQAIGNKP